MAETPPSMPEGLPHSTDEEPTRARQGRAETERRLIDAALELIQRNGVLAGLNLREVAAAAGVNRGNIYHYFGSRQELLRTAIARRFEAIRGYLSGDSRGRSFVQRRLRPFRSDALTFRDSHLRALLVIDGDDSVDPMPAYEPALRSLEQDVAEGQIDARHDLAALQVALSALLRGYRIFRTPYARRIGVSVEELDDRVSSVIRTWLESMAGPPAPRRGDPE